MNQWIEVDTDKLEDAILDILATYGDDSAKAISSAVVDEAAETRKKVRQNAKSAGIGEGRRDHGRRYVNSWQVTTRNSGQGTEATIHSSEYRLVHLLEKGHRNAYTGKQTRSFPHVAPAADGIENDLIKRIEENLSKLG